MATVVPRSYPDRAEFRAVWLNLDPATRRRVSAAAMRGDALEDPADAGLAAGFARHHAGRGRLMVLLVAAGLALFGYAVATAGSADDSLVRLIVPTLVVFMALLNGVRLLRLRRAERLNEDVLARHTTREEEPSPATASST